MRLEQSTDALVLTIADDGVEPGEDAEKAKLNLGISIIRRLSTQIEGDVSLERNAAGATWRVSVPL
jgi:two-component sensor histidine kinase